MFGISLDGAPWPVLLLSALLVASWSAFAWAGRALLSAWLTGQVLHIREHNERIETLKEVIGEKNRELADLKILNATLLNLTRGVQQTAKDATTVLVESVAGATRERNP